MRQIMRQSIVAVSATVLVGIGGLNVTLRAQAGDVALSRRVQVTFGTNVEPVAAVPPLQEQATRLQEKPQQQRQLQALAMLMEKQASTWRGAFVSAEPPAIDCAMPVVKGDPNVDPTIVKQPPQDGVLQSMRVIHVPSCADAR
jgi:hypothetical protein